MTIDKEKLKALAEASLIGDWYEAGDLRYSDRKTGEIHGLHHDDDRLIAAANPSTILALLAEIVRLETWRTAFLAERDAQIRQRDQLKVENGALRSAAMAAREFIMHEAEVRGLLDEAGQVSHRHPRRQAAIASIDAALVKEVGHG